jgi:hypothetical protein
LGLASTATGFAFAVTEGPRRLISWGIRRTPIQGGRAVAALEDVIREARPLFIAFDKDGSLRKGRRGRLFGGVVRTANDIHSVLVLPIDKAALKKFCSGRPTKRKIAEGLGKLFPELADRVPPVRKAWQPESAWLGVFMALGAAVAAWDDFRKGRT